MLCLADTSRVTMSLYVVTIHLLQLSIVHCTRKCLPLCSHLIRYVDVDLKKKVIDSQISYVFFASNVLGSASAGPKSSTLPHQRTPVLGREHQRDRERDGYYSGEEISMCRKYFLVFFACFFCSLFTINNTNI